MQRACGKNNKNGRNARFVIVVAEAMIPLGRIPKPEVWSLQLLLFQFLEFTMQVVFAVRKNLLEYPHTLFELVQMF